MQKKNKNKNQWDKQKYWETILNFPVTMILSFPFSIILKNVDRDWLSLFCAVYF